MKAAVCFMFAVFLVLVDSNEHLLGGLEPVIDGENNSDAEKGFQLIKNYLATVNDPEDNGYEIHQSFSDKKIYKQIVSGILYHYEFNLKMDYTCADTKHHSDCTEKPSVTKKCTAAVLEKASNTPEPLEFASGKEPKCY